MQLEDDAGSSHWPTNTDTPVIKLKHCGQWALGNLALASGEIPAPRLFRRRYNRLVPWPLPLLQVAVTRHMPWTNQRSRDL